MNNNNKSAFFKYLGTKNYNPSKITEIIVTLSLYNSLSSNDEENEHVINIHDKILSTFKDNSSNLLDFIGSDEENSESDELFGYGIHKLENPITDESHPNIHSLSLSNDKPKEDIKIVKFSDEKK